ncbi:hypothetical protein M3Y95_00355400 [Aphelenchoides besseyi]|nr:hypothetical protein M3Y95_00355400 [Aphelenchoides besseyi]
MNCQICSAPQAARHFGGISCRSCKGFFRRIVRLKIKYTCLSNGHCEISKSYCRACRWRRCKEAGMNPKLVQSDRTIDVVKKKFVVEDPNKNSLFSAPVELDKRMCVPYFGSLGSRQPLKAFDPTDYSTVVRFLLNIDQLVDNYYEEELNFCQVPPADLNQPLEVAFLFEPRRLCNRTKIHTQPICVPKVENFQFLWARALLQYVDGIFFYPQFWDLNINDQLLMATHRYIPVSSLRIAYDSLCLFEREASEWIFMAGGFYHLFTKDKEADKRTSTDLGMDYAIEIGHYIHDNFVEPAAELSVTKSEFVCLRSICFFTPVPGLSHHGRQVVLEAQRFYQQQLVQMVNSNGANLIKNCERLAALLALLPSIEKTSEIENRCMTLMNMFNFGGMRDRLPELFYMKNNT